MANMLYNGVELPALPEWDKTKYPYAHFGARDFNDIYGSDMGLDYNGLLLSDFSVTFSSIPPTYNESSMVDGNSNITLMEWVGLKGACEYQVASIIYNITDASKEAILSMGITEEELAGMMNWSFSEVISNTNPDAGVALYLVDENADSGSGPIVWCNADVMSNKDGSLYLAASEPVPVGNPHITTSSGNGFALYNGIKLPNIDSVWANKETYLYAFVTYTVLSADVAMYDVRFATTEYGYNGSRFYPVNNGTYVSFTTPANQATVDWINANGGNVSLGVWRESGSGSLVASRAVELDMRWHSFDIEGFGDATFPIPLDGMTVIEWDGVTDGNSIQIQTGYSIQRIGDYLPTDIYGGFVTSNTVADSNPITIYGSPSGSYSSIPDSYTAEASIFDDSWLVSYIGDELDYSVNALLSVKGNLPMSESVTVSEGLWVPVVGVNGNIAMYTPLVAYKTVETPPEDGGGDTSTTLKHHGRVNGTVYEVIGGRARIEGTGYDILGGRTRVNVVGYNISFGSEVSGDGGSSLGEGVLFDQGEASVPVQYIAVNPTSAAVNIQPEAGTEEGYIYATCGQGRMTAGSTTAYPPIYMLVNVGPVDFSGFSTLRMTVSANSSVILGYGDAVSTAQAANITNSVSCSVSGIDSRDELALDIGSVSGDQYVKFYTEAANTTVRAYKIWLE